MEIVILQDIKNIKPINPEVNFGSNPFWKGNCEIAVFQESSWILLRVRYSLRYNLRLEALLLKTNPFWTGHFEIAKFKSSRKLVQMLSFLKQSNI